MFIHHATEADHEMSTVSVVIPTYDRGDLVKRAIRSVLSQSFDSIELLVIDDHSPTPVREHLENTDIETDQLTIHRHSENMGGNAARNTGIDLASGQYVAFLDDDDEWYEKKIERQVQAAESTGAGVVYTGIEQFSDGTTNATKTPNTSGDVTEELLTGNFIGSFSAVLVKKDVIERVGYPDDDLPSWQDWDYYLRLSEETTFQAVPEPLVRRYSDAHEQISDDHSTKRDVTVPRFVSKHRQRAKNYGILSEFEATIAAEVGWSAALNGRYREAAKQYFNSLRLDPSTSSALYLLLVLGGSWTFVPAQIIKRRLVNMHG